MNITPYNKNVGFTLIELVIVIVILGVLAATAAPKFLDLSSDAKKANMKALEAAIITAAELVFYKAKIRGNVQEDGHKLQLDAGIVEIKGDGYPEAWSEYNRLSLVDLITIEDDWEVCYRDGCEEGDGGGNYVKIGYDTSSEINGCYVSYAEPGSDATPDKYLIEPFLNGC